MLSPGDRIKDCEVIAPLGCGGMAAVYLARRRGVGGFSRLVTIKLVHPHLVEDERVVELFLNEARISAQIAHPNVVHVEEIGEFEGSYFIAMEYVHGVTLAQLLARLGERRLRMRRRLCVWLAAQIAEALYAAHEARGENGAPLAIVHRDVSPQNVLIAHTGHVKLIDFGIAKEQADNDHRSRAQAVLGKLRYMSPEQLNLERADRRADVYALGVMLWEMLTGRTLLRCQRFDDERDWATRENPPAPSRYAGHSPPALDEVVLKAIAYRVTQRYQTAFEFRSALLRADADVAQIDAPMVAALMHALLGDELELRSALWPCEIVAELDATPGVTISRTWTLDELTEVNTVADERPDQHEDLVPTPTPGTRSFVDEEFDDEATLLVLRLQHSRAPTVKASAAPNGRAWRSGAHIATINGAALSAGAAISRALLRARDTIGRTGRPARTPASQCTTAQSVHGRSNESAFDTLETTAVRVPPLEPSATVRSVTFAIGASCLGVSLFVSLWLARPSQVFGPAGARAPLTAAAERKLEHNGMDSFGPRPPPNAHAESAQGRPGPVHRTQSPPERVLIPTASGARAFASAASVAASGARASSGIEQARRPRSTSPGLERVRRKRTQRRANRHYPAQQAREVRTHEMYSETPAENPYTSRPGHAADGGKPVGRAAGQHERTPERRISPAPDGLPSDDTTFTYWRHRRGISHP